MKAAIWLLATLACPGVAGAGALHLSLPAMPGGTAAVAALRRTVLSPYSVATRQPVTIVAAGAWDVAQLDPVTLADQCAAGTVRHIDWDRVGGRGRFVASATSTCGVGAFLHATVMAWDAAKVGGAPDWRGFWDVVRQPGRRGLQRTPVGTLEIALMSDGVAPADVYAVLRADGGVDHAFRRLDQLRPYVAWWRSDAEPMAMVASGAVAMSSAPYDRIASGTHDKHRRIGVQWAGSIVMVQSWAIASATRKADAAIALINVAADPGRQAALDDALGFGATLAPAATASVAAQMAGGVPFDAAFWQDHRTALMARFDAWLAH